MKEVQSVRALEDGQRWLTERRLCALQSTGQRPWTNLSDVAARVVLDFVGVEGQKRIPTRPAGATNETAAAAV